MTSLSHSVRDALRRAILTLAAMPGRIGPQFPVNCLANRIVREKSDAYGYTPERLRFQPTPRDVTVYLEVLGWITWYECFVDRRRARVFWAWAKGFSQERISRELGVSRQAIHQWLNDVCEAVMLQYPGETKRICDQPLDTLDASAILHANVADCVAPPKSPYFIREVDSIPTREAAHIEGSQAQRDRKITERLLQKRSRKWERIKKRGTISAA